MRYKPCDALGENLHAAALQWDCRLSVDDAERMLEFVCDNYPTRDFEGLLERALTREGVIDEAQRHAYKQAMGHFFQTRKEHARQKTREQDTARDEIPFAPR